MDMCVNYVVEHGGASFFKREDWRDELLGLVSKYPYDRGHYETEQEMESRIREELVLSRAIIQETIGTGKEVLFFAYPFGAYDSDLIGYLKNSGYMGALTTEAGGNHGGDDPFLIKRMVILEENSFGGLGNIFREYG